MWGCWHYVVGGAAAHRACCPPISFSLPTTLFCAKHTPELRRELRRAAGEVEGRDFRRACEQLEAARRRRGVHRLRALGAALHVAVRARLVAVQAHVELQHARGAARERRGAGVAAHARKRRQPEAVERAALGGGGGRGLGGGHRGARGDLRERLGHERRARAHGRRRGRRGREAAAAANAVGRWWCGARQEAWAALLSSRPRHAAAAAAAAAVRGVVV